MASLVLLSAHVARADEEPAPAPVAAPADVPAEAPPKSAPRGFGADGHVVLGDIIGFGLGQTSSPGALGSATYLTGWITYADASSNFQGQTSHGTRIGVTPSIDVFVGGGLSLGGEVTLFHASEEDSTGATSKIDGASVKPRVGYAVPLTTGFTFWPRVWGSIGGSRATGALATESAVTGVAWGVGGDALLVASLLKPITLTFGPTLAYLENDVGNTIASSSYSEVSLGVRGGLSLVF